MQKSINFHEMSHKSQPQYFPHIDALRAFAVLPVVLYHFLPQYCPGGYTGVDVFFVISGYLIVGGIFSDLRARKFSLVDFYVRRAKRILPAYFLVLIVTMLGGILIYSHKSLQSISTTSVWSLFYSTNIYFYNVVGYFDIAAKANPLLHLWSLGVEEQFYIIIPLTLFGLYSLRSTIALKGLIIIAAISLGLSIYCVNFTHQLEYSRFAFFMLPCRAWELIAGGILSQVRRPSCNSPKAASILSAIGCILILLPCFLLTESTPFPGIAAVPSILGAMLIIHFGSGGVGAWFFEGRLLVGIGRMSYSLYLWHWPILILLIGTGVGRKRALAGIAMSFLAAYLSWKFVESPVRRLREFSAKSAVSLTLCGSFAVAAICIFIHFLPLLTGDPSLKGDPLPHHWNGTDTWIVAENNHSPLRSATSLESLQEADKSVLIRIGHSSAPPCFALWGDSHALALLAGADSVARETEKSGYFINLKQGLTGDPDIGGDAFDPIKDREPVLQWLESNRSITEVILANRWFSHLRNDDDILQVVEICRRLSLAGKRVFIASNAPEASENTLRLIERKRLRSVEESAMLRAEYESAGKLQAKLLAQLKREEIATEIPVHMAFDAGSKYVTAFKTADGVYMSYFSDNSHLNTHGSLRAMRSLPSLLWGRKAD